MEESLIDIVARTEPLAPTKNQRRAKHQAQLFGMDKSSPTTNPASIPQAGVEDKPALQKEAPTMAVKTEEILLLKPKDIIVNQDRRGRYFAPLKADIKKLADSMTEHGQLQPVTVRVNADGKYELIYGYTRHSAALEAGLPLKATVTDADDELALIMNIRENTDRNTTTAVDDAHNQLRLRTMGWTNDAIGKVYKQSKAWVGQLAKLLSLPESVQKQVHNGEIAVTTAIGLASAGDDAETVKAEAAKIVESAKSGKSSKTGKVTREAAKKSAKQKVSAKKGEKPAPSKRNAKELFDFFQSLTGTVEKESLIEFGKATCKFIKGASSEKVYEKYLRTLLKAPLRETANAS